VYRCLVHKLMLLLHAWALCHEHVHPRGPTHLYAAETTSFRTLAASLGPSPSAACRSARFDSNSCSRGQTVWSATRQIEYRAVVEAKEPSTHVFAASVRTILVCTTVCLQGNVQNQGVMPLLVLQTLSTHSSNT